MVLVQKLDVTLASVKPGRFSSSETNYISYHGDLELKFSTEKMTDVISFWNVRSLHWASSTVRLDF